MIGLQLTGMERRESIFRVFVGSIVSHLVAERNALQEQGSPRLRDYCQKHGARFQAIDLRARASATKPPLGGGEKE